MAIINYIEKHTKTFSVKPHKHDYWEIIYVTAGSGKIETEDKHEIEYAKGETICIPPNLKHINMSSEGFKNIHLTIEDWSPSVSKPTLIPASNDSKDLLVLLNLSYKYFHMLPIKHSTNFALTAAIASHLTYLLDQPEGSQITQILVNEIINNCTDPAFSLGQAYELIPLSKEHVRKLFIKAYGITPLQYLIQKRIELAKQLLSNRVNNNLRVNEIALSCGFEDQAYFSRLFKNVTGTSPSAFQLNALTNNKIFEPS